MFLRGFWHNARIKKSWRAWRRRLIKVWLSSLVAMMNRVREVLVIKQMQTSSSGKSGRSYWISKITKDRHNMSRVQDTSISKAIQTNNQVQNHIIITNTTKTLVKAPTRYLIKINRNSNIISIILQIIIISKTIKIKHSNNTMCTMATSRIRINNISHIIIELYMHQKLNYNKPFLI